MENTINMEQPTLESESANNVNEQIIEKESVLDTSTLQEGSNYGKFKDATSLLNAYNNLEKEFTKKSQKLSELLKNTPQQETNINDINDTTCLTQNTVKDQYMYHNNNWHTEVSKFFEKYPDAKNYAKEIAQTIMTDESLAKNKNCLEYAYALASQRNQVKPADFINDPKNLKDIINNESIKQQIISNYLSEITNNKNNIRFISGEPKSISPTRPTDKPKTLQEASKIFKKLLES